ncbi:MAG TPA: ribonuclease HII [Firmicutes bacterium]|uniref:Ribonuclease HII n=1 Tax=Capillibacterium thermochitinicola TaxID=2699427 RepID=A0A8J6I2M9_9FIRM|nr:ribonuclease HII [Capillibacterium thermochitinicola]MBA2133838.1 ribonuclease HII [Capillibacterium thermochitinicola]HHW11633.1 ribonuclease HII [Bacillota bacterium]
MGKRKEKDEILWRQREEERLHTMYQLEHQLQAAGYRRIAGVDEAGRGPLAGPVVAAAAIIPPATFIGHLNDSKKLTAKQREFVYEQLMAAKIPYGLGQASVEEIDRLNILNASRLAMMRAVRNLPVPPDFLLIDGYAWAGVDIPHRGVVGGDALSLSIAAASVLAKVTRDRLMVELDRAFPGYGFAQHKGYPTAEHYAALARLGPCPIHRRSFNLHLQLTLDQAAGATSGRKGV